MSQWIWYPGDYEIYQNMLLHSRRQEFGADYPCFWTVSAPYPRVNFFRDIDCREGGEVTFFIRGTGYLFFDGARFAAGVPIKFSAGKHRIQAVTLATEGIPAIFSDSDIIPTDGEWYATPGTYTQDGFDVAKTAKECRRVGFLPAYTDRDADLSRFPFRKEKIKPVKFVTDGAFVVYDFGRESFGRVCLVTESDDVVVSYGESYEEAVSYGKCGGHSSLVYERIAERGSHELASRAFRYVAVLGKAWGVCAKTELLPLKYAADFRCDDPEVKKIFDLCAYTFHLCAREVFLDGIKRDRWCWSGDAYQSYMVNDYLFTDRETTKRTITALYGKPPYYEHINTINDYSALLIIGTAEYVFRSGDTEFLQFLRDKVTALYDFIISRLDERGYVVGRPGDWVFVDWSDIDKTGAVAAEQILLFQVYRSMADIAGWLGQPDVYTWRANALREKIERDFWCEEAGAYRDSCDSDKNHISRHANIFAIIYDFCTRERAERICRSVLENDNITKITTPYFEFYELMALCKMGRLEIAQKMLKSYWGGMLSLGATSIWEAYDPGEQGTEHYAMYGSDYGKSLCHAWGAGPICFLGRYCAGVRPTSFGSETFTVAPDPGLYETFTAKVPMRDGVVEVRYDRGRVSVSTTLTGGTLVFGGQEKPIIPGVVCEI